MVGNELRELEFPRDGAAREMGREDQAAPSKERHGDVVNGEEPRRLERDRARVALDDDGVEGQLVGGERLSTTVNPAGDFEDVAAHAEGGAET